MAAQARNVLGRQAAFAQPLSVLLFIVRLTHSRQSRQHTQSSRMPPAIISGMYSSSDTANSARITRRTTAASKPQEDHLAPIRLGHMRRRHADDDGIVARQHEVDQDDLNEREESAMAEDIEQRGSSSVRALLGPARLRRQGHQNGFGVAAGFQAELGAAVVQQVELHIAAAAHQLVVPVGIASSFVPCAVL